LQTFYIEMYTLTTAKETYTSVMISLSKSIILLFLLVAAVCSSPFNDVDLVHRALSPAQCSSVVSVVNVLKVNQATSFCESFLSVQTKTTVSITSVNML